MKIIRDLSGMSPPPVMDLFFNKQLATDGGAAYNGQLTKIMDVADVDHGRFITSAANATATLNHFGILQEDIVAATGAGYLPDSTTYGMVRRKIQPVLPSSLIEAEYVQKDRAGTDNYETGATASAAGTTLTCATGTIDTDDLLIGGWIYFLNGANAYKLHYITDSANAGDAITVATAFSGAVVAADDFLVILPAFVNKLVVNATATDIKSDTDDSNWAIAVVGLDHFVQAHGMPRQGLDRNKHDGIYLKEAKFFHQFLIPSYSVFITGTD